MDLDPDPGTPLNPDPQHCAKWYSLHCTVLKIADTMWLLLPLWPLLPTALLVSSKSVQVNQFYDLQFCFCLLRDLPVVKCGRKPHYYRSFVPPTQKLGIIRGIVCALQARNNRETRHALFFNCRCTQLFGRASSHRSDLPLSCRRFLRRVVGISTG
jgi:hypothetical protein